MTPSIMQPDEKRCYVTGYQSMLDKHHVIHGFNRNAADELGLWVWLRHDIHMKLHAHQHPFESLDLQLKVEAQKCFEARGHTRDEFMQIFGRSYL